MVVIGIDFGDKFCVVSRKGEKGENRIVLNDRHERKTDSYVSFVDKRREFGIAAKNLHATNIGSTFKCLKGLISGITEKQKDGSKIVPTAKKLDLAPFVFKFRDENEQFNCIQLLAMFLSELKAYAESDLNEGKKPWEEIHVTGCHISVPIYFSPFSRKALLSAAGIANLSVHSLVRETTAVALAYSQYKRFTETKNVVFVDFGHHAIQICIWRFTSQGLEVLAEVSDEIGGKDVDENIAEHFLEKIRDKQLGRHFYVKFMEEIETLKNKMSLDIIPQKLNIGLLLNDETTQFSMKRSEMEDLCKDLFVKIEALMERCLQESKLDKEEISSIELIGGSTRIPKISELILNVFGKNPLSTMNRDEAVALGCLRKQYLAETHKGIKLSEGQFTQSSSVLSRKLITIHEVHSDFSDMKKDCLVLTRDELKIYKKEEKSLKAIDRQEKERGLIRNKLVSLITSEKKLFDAGNLRYSKDELEKLSRSNNETIEWYQEKFDELSKYIEQEKERNRIEAKDKLQAFIRGLAKEKSFNLSIRSDLNHDKSWSNGKTEEYQRKLAEWKKIARLEQERIEARDLLISFINKAKQKTNVNRMSGLDLLKDTQSQLNEAELWQNGTTEEYAEKLEDLQRAMKDEDERANAYKELLMFIKTDETMKFLLHLYPELKSDFEQVRKWKNGSTEDYKKELAKWKRIVENEKQRQKDRCDLLEFIEQHEKSKSLLSGYLLDKYKTDFTFIKKYNKGTSGDYQTVLHRWQQDVKVEKERIDAREELLSYIEQEEGRAKGLLVDIIDENMEQKLQKIKTSQDETVEFYRNALATCKNYAAEEDFRRQCRKNLLDYIIKLEKSWPSINSNSSLTQELSMMKSSLNKKKEFYVDSLKRCKEIIEDEKARHRAYYGLLDFIKSEEVRGGFPENLSDDLASQLRMIKHYNTNESQQFYESMLKNFRAIVYNEKLRREAYKSLLDCMERSIFKYNANDSINQELEGFRKMSQGSKDACEAALVRCKEIANQLIKQQEAYEKISEYKNAVFLQCSNEKNDELDVFNEVLKQRLRKVYVLPQGTIEYYENAWRECNSIFKEEEKRHSEYVKLLQLFINIKENSDAALLDFYKSKVEEEHKDVETWYTGSVEQYQEYYTYWSKTIAEEDERLKARQEFMTYLGNDVSKLQVEGRLTSEQSEKLDKSFESADECIDYYITELAHWKDIVFQLTREINVPSTSTQGSNFFTDEFIKKCKDTISKIRMKCKDDEAAKIHIYKIESFYTLTNKTGYKNHHKHQRLEKLLEECLESLKDYISHSSYNPMAWVFGNTKSSKLNTFESKFKQLNGEIEKFKHETWITPSSKDFKHPNVKYYDRKKQVQTLNDDDEPMYFETNDDQMEVDEINQISEEFRSMETS